MVSVGKQNELSGAFSVSHATIYGLRRAILLSFLVLALAEFAI
jgi:hypothetical protein